MVSPAHGRERMKLLLIYDIVDDNIRGKVADICLEYGLERIQYSAFLGELNHNRQEEMLQKMKRRLGKGAGNIRLYPLCERDLKLMKVIGKKGE